MFYHIDLTTQICNSIDIISVFFIFYYINMKGQSNNKNRIKMVMVFFLFWCDKKFGSNILDMDKNPNIGTL